MYQYTKHALSAHRLVGLKEGLSALSEACDKWENFGIQIELPYSYLSKIRGEFSRNDDRMRELLNERLKKGDLTWKTVVKALRDKSVGKEDLAEKIEKEHLKPPRGQKFYAYDNYTDALNWC